VENGGFGASVAAPIASLLIEQYINGKVERPELVEYIEKMEIAYPNYEKRKR
jgi:penicillin-binding protein 2